MNMDYETICNVLEYEPDTGLFFWTENVGYSIKAGSKAGGTGTNNGRHSINIQYKWKKYRAHRLAWFIMAGFVPEMVDHINGDATDNRWENLREVNYQESALNRPLYSNNKTGVTGVQWNKRLKRWIAMIKFNGENRHLYCGLDFFEACCARKSAECLKGFHVNHGLRIQNQPVMPS